MWKMGVGGVIAQKSHFSLGYARFHCFWLFLPCTIRRLLYHFLVVPKLIYNAQTAIIVFFTNPQKKFWHQKLLGSPQMPLVLFLVPFFLFFGSRFLYQPRILADIIVPSLALLREGGAYMDCNKLAKE